jgi:ParB family chromosome partitioning protein
LVRPAPGRPGFYEICCGHTRRDIAVEHGFTEGVKAEILMLTDREMLELAFSENFNRNGLNPLDTTDSLLRIIQGRGVTGSIPALARSLQRAENPSPEELIVQTVLAEFGVGLPTFRSWLGILNKPQDVLDAIRDGSIPFSKAVELAKVENPAERAKLIDRVTSEDISVRDLRHIIAPAKPVPEPAQQQRQQHLARLARAQIPADRQARFAELMAELMALIPEEE